MDRRHMVAAVSVVVAGSSLGSLTSTSRPGGGDGRRRTSEESRRRLLPNIVLRTHAGKEVRLYDDLLRDKTVLINFMYTACEDDCPLTAARLAQVQTALGERLGRTTFIYSISIDPERDTPEVLSRYARRFGAKPGWLFLTGMPGEIKRLRRAFGDDPGLPAQRSDHLNLIRLGIEPLARWSGCPTWTRPEAIVRYLSWMEPRGERPLPRPSSTART